MRFRATLMWHSWFTVASYRYKTRKDFNSYMCMLSLIIHCPCSTFYFVRTLKSEAVSTRETSAFSHFSQLHSFRHFSPPSPHILPFCPLRDSCISRFTLLALIICRGVPIVTYVTEFPSAQICASSPHFWKPIACILPWMRQTKSHNHIKKQNYNSVYFNE